MTTHTIKFKRGIKSKLGKLSYGEPAYISDEHELYIGAESGVKKITSNKEVKELSSQLEHIESVVDIPTYNLNKITKELGITKGIQSVFNEVGETGIGRILLDKVYEIDEPLLLERTNSKIATSIEIYGGGCIKKSSSFNGDRLLTIKIGYHDEDNIIFNNISFDGVDRTVNGIDTFNTDLAYNLECTNKSQHNESKFIKLNDCTFINCYHGVRLSSLSWVFKGCLFHSNNYGVYLDCSANANTFLGCSIRRNIIGVKAKQFDSTIGTIANGFYNCTIESNHNLGFISKLSRNTKLIGNYFENNGYNINTNFENSSKRRVHILLQDSGGAGQHTIDNFYNVSDFDIVGHFLNSTIINPCKVELQLANNTSFVNNNISNISFVGFGEYTSSFTVNNEKYKSSKSKILYKESEYIGGSLLAKDKNYAISKTSTIESNTIHFLTLNLKNIIDKGNVMLLDINSTLQGQTSSGNPASLGVITGTLVISKSTSSNISYMAHIDDLKLINCNGASSGAGVGLTTNKMFKDNASISVTNNDNIITLNINNINTESMINWGVPIKVKLEVNIKCKFARATSIQQYDSEFLTLS